MQSSTDLTSLGFGREREDGRISSAPRRSRWTFALKAPPPPGHLILSGSVASLLRALYGVHLLLCYIVLLAGLGRT